jgi:hypothetical protein
MSRETNGKGQSLKDTPLGGGVREVHEGDKRDPPAAAPAGDIQAAADHAILLVSEVLALLFALPFGDALYHHRPISGWDIFYLVVGLLFAVGGPMWPAIRPRLPAAISTSLARAALDARLLIAALLLIFVYVLVGPEIYRRFTEPQTAPINADEIAAATVKKLPAAPTADDIAAAVMGKITQAPTREAGTAVPTEEQIKAMTAPIQRQLDAATKRVMELERTPQPPAALFTFSNGAIAESW